MKENKVMKIRLLTILLSYLAGVLFIITYIRDKEVIDFILGITWLIIGSTYLSRYRKDRLNRK